MKTLRERFWAKVDLFHGITDEDCWNWVGAVDKQGYGRFNVGGMNAKASRTAFEIYKSAIPVGLFVLHRCDNPSCVNPSHLRLGNNQQNVDDKMERNRGRWRNGFRGRQSDGFCLRGHPLTESNSYFRKDKGQIVCKKCRANYARKHYHAKKTSKQL